jgi:hypothetical protein
MCALDAIASYGYKNHHVRKFIRNHFPPEYKAVAYRIYPEYRVTLIHLWNLFGDASMTPGNDPIVENADGTINVGIMNFVQAFEQAVEDFLDKLKTEPHLQERALFRYRELSGEIPRYKPNRTLVPVLIGFGIGVGATLLLELAFHKFR